MYRRGIIVEIILVVRCFLISLAATYSFDSLYSTIKPQSSQAKKHFSSVLFIVKYNYNAPLDRLLWHSSFWSTIFEHQLVLVPYNSTLLQTANEMAKKGVEVISCLDTDPIGYWAYSSITTAIHLHPQFEGYLYAHDDMALNISRLMTLDLQSFWVTGDMPENTFVKLNHPFYLEHNWNFRNHTWDWLNKNVGIDAMENVLRKYPVFRKRLKLCTGSERGWFWGQSDFFYVPRHQKSLYLDVMEKFAREKLFLEIALPTFTGCFVPKSLLEQIQLCTFWDNPNEPTVNLRNNLTHMETNCPPSSSAYHPIKLFFDKRNLDFMIKKTGISFKELDFPSA